ncbi:hypothetical protein L873DRAFT_1226466 [Choiromyces venosus 120613-1]|uniref:Secreted protein n=1 Tax=Choiromyces venosus 120613-1 TaxID=1336337 RepID=A0A3N4JJ51_9PEZI|nr:hypothetical protein L873DRAFT_1226466 [Choiromyces venosus 120613-1]
MIFHAEFFLSFFLFHLSSPTFPPFSVSRCIIRVIHNDGVVVFPKQCILDFNFDFCTFIYPFIRQTPPYPPTNPPVHPFPKKKKSHSIINHKNKNKQKNS